MRTRDPLALALFASAHLCAAGCVVGFEDYPVADPNAGVAGTAQDGGGFAGSAGTTSWGGASGSSGVGGGFETGGTGGGSGTAGSAAGGGSGVGGSSGSGGGAGCPTGQSCAPNAPSGWQGPVRVWFGTTAGPSCASHGWASAIPAGAAWYEPGVSFAAHSCFTCSCGLASGDCNATLTFSSTSACMDSADVEYVSYSGCKTLSGAGLAYARLTQLTPKNGSCPPNQTGSANIPDPVGNRAVACTPGGGATCGAGSTCIDSPTSPFAAVCVFSERQTSCPNEYPNPKSYEQWTDTRFCTPCACSTPSQQSCAGTTIDVWGGGCTAPSAPVSVGVGCTSLGSHAPAANKSLQIAPSYTAGSCTPGGGTAVGASTKDAAIELCCL